MTIPIRIHRLNGAPLAFILFVAMYIAYALHMPSALSLFSITNLFNNTVVLALAAAGLTFVILIKEMDISPVGVIAVTNVLVATQSASMPHGALLCFLLCCFIGLAIGLINGILVAYLRLQSLACTLSTMIVCQGVALLILPAPGGDVAEFISYQLTDLIGGVLPVSAAILVLVAVVWLYIRRTSFGIGLYAVGTDETAAYFSGIKVSRIRLGAFALAGLFYGIAGYMLSAQISSGDPRVSSSFLLYVFAAVAIGGTSLSGGRGGIMGSLAGAGILTIMQKMLFSLGVSDFYTNIFNGVIMVLAILLGNSTVLLSKWRELHQNSASPSSLSGYEKQLRSKQNGTAP
ncbi:MAG: ABC transporter permease [Desulfarculaceae bacterium]|jgi:ribose transport system permease protein